MICFVILFSEIREKLARVALACDSEKMIFESTLDCPMSICVGENENLDNYMQ